VWFNTRFAIAALPEFAKSAIFEFLGTLVLFPPDDTASNLDPGNPNANGYPQRGHGSIHLPANPSRHAGSRTPAAEDKT
jgi:hypothetical protein